MGGDTAVLIVPGGPQTRAGSHRGFTDLADRLLRQTLPAEDFEVWFCDDGSEPETIGRLEALHAEHPHLKVMLLPHTGWPGTPRNAAFIAAADMPPLRNCWSCARS